MFEQTTRLAAEALARAVDRRTFLKRASQAVFASALSLAAGHAFSGSAAAAGTKPPEQMPTPQCAPPGPYCNTGGGILTGCRGAHCFQHLHNGQVLACRVYYQWYQAGCWTTASGGGYWTCCDCECFNSSGTRLQACGCAMFSTSPSPLPAGPGSGAQD